MERAATTASSLEAEQDRARKGDHHGDIEFRIETLYSLEDDSEEAGKRKDAVFDLEKGRRNAQAKEIADLKKRVQEVGKDKNIKNYRIKKTKKSWQHECKGMRGQILSEVLKSGCSHTLLKKYLGLGHFIQIKSSKSNKLVLTAATTTNKLQDPRPRHALEGF
ncbi:hypothetical protein Tco_0818097 [Tanacetum coccineum]